MIRRMLCKLGLARHNMDVYEVRLFGELIGTTYICRHCDRRVDIPAHHHRVDDAFRLPPASRFIERSEARH